MAVRATFAEQLFDSICLATGRRNQERIPDLARIEPVDTVRSQFLASFGDAESNSNTPTSLLHALYLMNSKFTSEATGLEQSGVVVGMAQAPSTHDTRNIQELFLNTLSRRPRPQETAELLNYTATGERRQAWRTYYGFFLIRANSCSIINSH